MDEEVSGDILDLDVEERTERRGRKRKGMEHTALPKRGMDRSCLLLLLYSPSLPNVFCYHTSVCIFQVDVAII